MPLSTRAQNSKDRVFRLGLLRATTVQARDYRALVSGLREHGWVEGTNIQVEARHADGVIGRLPQLAEELVRTRPDLVVVDGNPTAQAMRAASAGSPIPIVFVVVNDPVRLGFADTIARPGGRMTGLSNLGIDLIGKRVEILKEAVPDLSRLGVLIQPGNFVREHRAQVEEAARARGITLVEYPADSPDELPGALGALASGGVQAALTVGSPLFYSARERIVTVLNKAGVPGMHPEREFVEAGGFLSYGIDFPALWRQAAGYVDKILSGTSPADLPIQQPVRFELLVNLRTARLIQKDIAPSFLARADEVIE
jgi:putative ABC transport system substrate-binding protein